MENVPCARSSCQIDGWTVVLDNPKAMRFILRMSKNILGWTDIPVNDIDRAIAFDSKVLSAPVTLQKYGDMAFGLLPHAENSASGCLAKCLDNQPSRTGPLIYLSVDGRLDDAVTAVSENGGKVLEPKHAIGPYGFRAVIVDSEGNRIALHSETA
jgi:predicted enzyme related to lactoylglutathione lyase